MTQGNEQIAAAMMRADSVRPYRKCYVVDTLATHTTQSGSDAIPATQDTTFAQRLAMDVLVGLVIGVLSAALSVAIAKRVNGK